MSNQSVWSQWAVVLAEWLLQFCSVPPNKVMDRIAILVPRRSYWLEAGLVRISPMVDLDTSAQAARPAVAIPAAALAAHLEVDLEVALAAIQVMEDLVPAVPAVMVHVWPTIGQLEAVLDYLDKVLAARTDLRTEFVQFMAKAVAAELQAAPC
jgi:hypothetical protein